MNDAIKKYLAEIGARGGKANAGKPGRSEICRQAAKTRWARKKWQEANGEPSCAKMKKEYEMLMASVKAKPDSQNH